MFFKPLFLRRFLFLLRLVLLRKLRRPWRVLTFSTPLTLKKMRSKMSNQMKKKKKKKRKRRKRTKTEQRKSRQRQTKKRISTLEEGQCCSQCGQKFLLSCHFTRLLSPIKLVSNLPGDLQVFSTCLSNLDQRGTER